MLRRGDIVAFRAPRKVTGHEQRGARYAVVAQADEFEWLRTLIVVPTSTRAQSAIFRPSVTVAGRATRLLCDQVSTVDRGRLGRRVGRLTRAELDDLDECLARLVGLF